MRGTAFDMLSAARKHVHHQVVAFIIDIQQTSWLTNPSVIDRMSTCPKLMACSATFCNAVIPHVANKTLMRRPSASAAI
jgi:hypothetical protein